MAKVQDSFAHDVFRFLPAQVRDLDVSGTLERLMGGPQWVFENQQNRIQELDTLHDVDAIEDRYLTFLKHHVGWTNELDVITSALSADQLRKLIKLSVPFWKGKGTEQGIRDALRLLTGRDVVIRNWFYYRWIVGVTALGTRRGDERDPFLTGRSHGIRDQYLSIIYVSNELPIDRQLVRDLVNLHRPLQEAYIIVFVDLVDDFGVGRDKWSTVAGVDPVWDEDRKLLEIPAGTTVGVNVDGVTSWDEVVWRKSVTYTTSSGGEFRVQFRRQAAGLNDRYEVTFEQNGDVTIEAIIGGVVVATQSGSVGHVIPEGEGVVYGINVIRSCTGTGQMRIKVTVYERVVIDVNIAIAILVPPGRWRVENVGPNTIEMDNVIAYQLPVTVDEVIGSGVVASEPEPLIVGPCVHQEWTSFTTWTLGSQWHSSGFRYIVPTTSLYFGTGESGWHTWGIPGAMGPGIVAGTAESPTFSLVSFPAADYDVFLEFQVYPDLRAAAGDDIFTYEVLVSGTPVFSATLTSKDTAAWRVLRTSDLSSVVGGLAAVSVRFTLDTVTAPSPGDEGVFVDQVRILIQEK
jgi:phage tail-like protein